MSTKFQLNLMVKVKFPNFEFFCNLQMCLVSKIKMQYRSRNWLCLEFSGTIQKEAPRKMIYSCWKYRRQTNLWESSYRIFFWKTWLSDPSGRVGKQDCSFISTENELRQPGIEPDTLGIWGPGANPRSSERREIAFWGFPMHQNSGMRGHISAGCFPFPQTRPRVFPMFPCPKGRFS